MCIRDRFMGGTLNVGSRVQGNGTGAGLFLIASGITDSFGTTFTNIHVLVTGGLFRPDGLVSHALIEVRGGSLSLTRVDLHPGTNSSTALLITGGTTAITGGVEGLELTSGTVGTSDLTLTGKSSWTGGAIEHGPIDLQGDLTIQGSPVLFQSSMSVHGKLVLTSGVAWNIGSSLVKVKRLGTMVGTIDVDTSSGPVTVTGSV